MGISCILGLRGIIIHVHGDCLIEDSEKVSYNFETGLRLAGGVGFVGKISDALIFLLDFRDLFTEFRRRVKL